MAVIDMTIIGCRVSDFDLIKAWFTNKTMPEISYELRLSNSAIRYTWRRLKGEGKIPDISRNQRAAMLKRMEQPQPIAQSRSDLRPAAIEDDRLLRKLIEVHKEPRYDIPRELQ